MTETICALASGPPPAGIAIVRVSGPDAASWAAAHLGGPPLENRAASVRAITDSHGVLVDEALVLFMKGPHSYTGEDVLELNLHGGRAVIEHALETLTSFEGIRFAEPGEFTRRAFEAGRLDLTQAEGIADLVEAETRGQKTQALAQTNGALLSLYNGWREELVTLLALIEVTVDFPDEEDAPDHTDEPVATRLAELITSFETALEHGRVHQSIRDGFRVALIGAPNVGKSTLLNQLAGREAAIVTDIPGTTRDVVEVRCRVGSHIVWFADTAGLRETDNVIEAEGIRRAETLAAEADLRLFVYEEDGPAPPPSLYRTGDLSVRNKLDKEVNQALTPETLAISALTGAGVDQLLYEIAGWLDRQTSATNAPVITRLRHREGIERALRNTRMAAELLARNMGAELVAEEVRLAARSLASLVGEINVEDVLGAVFSEFCIGK